MAISSFFSHYILILLTRIDGQSRKILLGHALIVHEDNITSQPQAVASSKDKANRSNLCACARLKADALVPPMIEGGHPGLSRDWSCAPISQE